MLKRIHIKGYKSLEDVEVELKDLTVLVGPNAAGKSNFLEAIQLLSRLATERNIKEAFQYPHRGKPLEAFTVKDGGFAGLRESRKLSFSIEVDLCLSDAVVESVNLLIQQMRGSGVNGEQNGRSRVREKYLRYRLEIEMLPNSAVLRVADEYLTALNARGEPSKKRKPFIEREGEKIHLRMEGQGHPTYFERYLDHTILSISHYVPYYPHLEAVWRELNSWNFFYLEPRELMRSPVPLKPVDNIGPMGEELPGYLYSLMKSDPEQFEALNRAMRVLINGIDEIDPFVNDIGEAEFRLKADGVPFSARLLSEGTLRLIGILASAGRGGSSSLVGFEEPENGVHSGIVSLIADFLRTQVHVGKAQYIVTTHSKELASKLIEDLYVVKRNGQMTEIEYPDSIGTLLQYLTLDEAERILEEASTSAI